MAAIDTYTAEGVKDVYTSGFVNGAKVLVVRAKYTPVKTPVASGSTIRFFKDIDSNLIPLELKLSNSASLGSVSVGIYHPNGGKAINETVLGAAVDTASAGKNIDCLTAITVPDMDKSLAELAEIDETKEVAVDIGVKTAAALSTPVVLTGLFLQR